MPPARELVITYGGYSCSPDGQYSYSETFDTFSLQFTFLITATTEAAFASALTAAVDAFRDPFNNLTVVLGGQTLISISQSANTGLEVHSEILKQEHISGTGRSVRLTVRIIAGLPAGNVSTSGLREFSVNVDFSPSRRRTVTLGGIWTAVGGSSARTMYDAGIAAQAATIKTALGITTWEVVGEPRTEQSYHDQTLSFSITYKEILFGQIGSGDDSSVVDQHLRISLGTTSVRFAPGGLDSGVPGSTSDRSSSGQSRPFISVEATFECFVDFDVSTDLASIWRRARAWIIPLMRAATGSGVFALTDDNPQYDYDDNRVSGQLRGVAVPSGVTSIAREHSVSDTDEKGVVLVPVWDGSRAYSKFRYPGPGQKLRTTRTMSENVSGGGGSGAGPIAGTQSASVGGAAFRGGSDRGGLGSSGTGGLFGIGVPGFVPAFGPGTEVLGNSAFLGNGDVPGFGSSPSRGGVAGGGGLFGLDVGGQPQGTSALIREDSENEPFEIGLPDGGATIKITRTTHTTVVEFYDEVG